MKLTWLRRVLRWREGSQANQYVMAVMVSVPIMSFGMALGWLSPNLGVLLGDSGLLAAPLTPLQLSWVVSAPFLTSLPCMLLAGAAGDAAGRKALILLTSFTIAMCWLIKLVYLSAWSLILARAILGIANAGCFVTAPIYFREISDDNIRGALGSLVILSQNLGYIIMYICGDMLAFKTVLWISLVIPLVHLVFFWVMPDTPSYLVKRGKIQEATEVLAWLRSVDVSDLEVVEQVRRLQAEVSGERSEWKTLFTDPTTFKAFRLTLVVLLAQELSGYLVLLTFASQVFEEAGANTLTPNQQTMIIGVVQLVGSMVATGLVERVGRKPLLVVTSATAGLGMLALGSWFYAGRRSVPWLPALAMCLTIFSQAAGLAPASFVIMTEMFAYKLRGIVTSIAVALTALADFVQMEAFTPLQALVGIHGTCWLFALVCLLSTGYILLWVPETRNKSLEEIYAKLSAVSVKKKKAAAVA